MDILLAGQSKVDKVKIIFIVMEVVIYVIFLIKKFHIFEETLFFNVLYSCYMKFYFYYQFNIYDICFIMLLVDIYVLCVFYIRYIFVFSYYYILNLCDNVSISVICAKLLSCKFLITKRYISNFLCYLKTFVMWFLNAIRQVRSGPEFVYLIM